MSDVLAVPVKEAARRLSVSPDTVYRAIKRGDLQAKRLAGRIVVPVRALEAFVDAA